MEMIIKDLEDELTYSDKHISNAWEDIERHQSYLAENQKRVADAFDRYNRNIKRKEELRRAIEVLRNA